jgi:small subunit ribosomal protein S21
MLFFGTSVKRRWRQQVSAVAILQLLSMTEIKLRKGEPVEKAIRRLKKKLDREQTLQQFRMRRRFEKPSARRRRKEKAARFAAMLKARYAED